MKELIAIEAVSQQTRHYPNAKTSIVRWTSNASSVSPADTVPISPICSAIVSNFCWSGVGSSPSCNELYNIPMRVFSPTAQTSIFPLPSITSRNIDKIRERENFFRIRLEWDKIPLDPEIKKGLSSGLFLTSAGYLCLKSLSPVIVDSSILTSEPSSSMPSIERISPIFK